MHVVLLFHSPVKSGDMGASKQLLSDLKTKIFQLCEISAVSFHGVERREGHSHSSCSDQMWQATKNTEEVKDGENGQIIPTHHLLQGHLALDKPDHLDLFFDEEKLFFQKRM